MFTIIEKDLIKKPQLGGWRNKVTRVTYLNGESQTGPPPKRVSWEKTCSRKVQTVFIKDNECQSSYEQATQMWRRDCYIPSVSDKYVTVKPYETYEEMRIRLDVDGKARVIQRCYRAYRILKFVKECALLYRKMREDCDRLEEERLLARSERYKADCHALNNPRNMIDFDALLSHIETVELSNKSTIESLSPRCRALKLLEARRRAFLIADVQTRKARESREQRKKERFLAYHCEPKKWLDKKGRVVEMLSLRNQAAIECWKMYEELRAPVEGMAVENRMEILLKARSSIENHDCKLANIFRGLVDQEILLLAKHLDPKKFNFLRKRITGAFLQFLKTSHNCTCKSVDGNGTPGIDDYEFREPLEKDRNLCVGCRKLLPRKKFPVAVRKQQSNKCKACIRLRTNVLGHVDLRPYVHLLATIRESERSLGCELSLADALTPSDLRHLVLDIWHGHSVLSERSEPQELRLPRYNLNEPWSPWNCVLLTEDEAEMHCGEIGKFLAEHLRMKIRLAHCTARMDFRLDWLRDFVVCGG